MITRQDAFRQRIKDGSRELDERFQMLCLCQEPRAQGCSAVPTTGGFNNRLSMFLKGWESDPFCGRAANGIMKAGLFKGRKYCWQHYDIYAICDTCLFGGAKTCYVWEYHPQQLPYQPFKWEERGRLHFGPIPEYAERFNSQRWNGIGSGEWVFQKSLWLCYQCKDALSERMERENKKRRNALLKQAKALREGRQTISEIKRLLKEKRNGLFV